MQKHQIKHKEAPFQEYMNYKCKWQKNIVKNESTKFSTIWVQ